MPAFIIPMIVIVHCGIVYLQPLIMIIIHTILKHTTIITTINERNVATLGRGLLAPLNFSDFSELLQIC